MEMKEIKLKDETDEEKKKENPDRLRVGGKNSGNEM